MTAFKAGESTLFLPDFRFISIDSFYSLNGLQQHNFMLLVDLAHLTFALY